MLAAVEIYNKPQMSYRDECFVILLINAWELLAKAILSKNKQRIYAKKEPGKPYKTFTLRQALKKAAVYFPASMPYKPVMENIRRLAAFRNNTVHFYNDSGFSVVLYGFSQTCIVNYKDLVFAIFGHDITEEITFTLLPLGFGAAPDPIAYLRDNSVKRSQNQYVTEYLREIFAVTRSLEDQQLDTGRFLTRFDLSLQSVNKISTADLVVGVAGNAEVTSANILVQRTINSNQKYPFKRTDVRNRIGDTLGGRRLNDHLLNAIIHAFDCKSNTDYIFVALGGGAMQYSPEFIRFLQGLSISRIDHALAEYQSRTRKTNSETYRRGSDSSTTQRTRHG